MGCILKRGFPLKTTNMKFLTLGKFIHLLRNVFILRRSLSILVR